MIVNIKAPSPGESIYEVEIENWLVKDNSFVTKEQKIAEISSDKATIEILAEQGGVISISKQEGEIVKVDDIIASIDTSKEGQNSLSKNQLDKSQQDQDDKKHSYDQNKKVLSPAARKIVAKENIKLDNIDITNKKGIVSKQDVLKSVAYMGPKREQKITKMSSFRRKLSERMVYVKNETAMLTTFNEVDMSEVIDMRVKYKESFEKKHNIKLGFMSFFSKAICYAIGNNPSVNSMIDGNNIISCDYIDISIAVSTDKGLMVPVLRDVQDMGFKEIELEIKRLSTLARDNKLSVDDMTGGNFTITNGGIFGSMLSTPLINPPQSSILGMHNIVKRPIVSKDYEIVIKPIMYLALSYDHRLIDGKESVTFLMDVKKAIEDPLAVLMNNEVESSLGI